MNVRPKVCTTHASYLVILDLISGLCRAPSWLLSLRSEQASLLSLCSSLSALSSPDPPSCDRGGGCCWYRCHGKCSTLSHGEILYLLIFWLGSGLGYEEWRLRSIDTLILHYIFEIVIVGENVRSDHVCNLYSESEPHFIFSRDYTF